MLEPLNPEKLDALQHDDDDDAGCDKVSAARYFFGEQDMAQGLEALLRAFKIFNPYLIFEEEDGVRRWNNWHIKFYDSPFDTLYLQPCGDSIEIFGRDRFLVAYVIMGRPQNWARRLRWIWAYGDEAYVKEVKKGSMLRPLDRDKLLALGENENDNDCESIRRIKTCLGNEKNLAKGIVCLFEKWGVFAPYIRRDKEETEDSWHVTFYNSPFRSLRIQPDTIPGVVHVYAFEKILTSFWILNNTNTSDRDEWQRLLKYVWGYGRRRLEHKRRWEETQRLLHKSHVKSQPKSKRTEKPLLHKVLHTAGFKAQCGAAPRADRKPAIQAKEDHIMEDVDTGVHTKKTLNRQLFTQKSPLRTTDPNPQLGTLCNAKDMVDCLTAKAAVDDVDIGALAIMDCQP